jgi:phosphopantothenoylcysteine decarboxylase
MSGVGEWTWIVELAACFPRPQCRRSAPPCSRLGGTRTRCTQSRNAHTVGSATLARYTEVGDAVLHIRLADRNLGLLIAPLDANTLAKITVGTADNLLSCVVRAWCWRMEPEFDAQVSAKHGPQAVRRPVVLAPAMNTFMWHQQSTQNALGALRTAGASVIEPVVKTLACGVRGAGALADPTDIVDALVTEMYEWVGAQQAAEAGGLPALVRST